MYSAIIFKCSPQNYIQDAMTLLREKDFFWTVHSINKRILFTWTDVVLVVLVDDSYKMFLT
jgi:hypothetical protein